MIFLLLFALHITGPVEAYDPFEGWLAVNCLKGRSITGCNETLLEAYNRTSASKTDPNINKADTQVFLFTGCNKEEPEFLHLCGGRLPNNTLYKAGNQTVIIIGGHLSSVCGVVYLREMKDQLLCRGPYNVILIDWYWGVGPDVYGIARNAEVLGKQLAFLMMNIMEQTGASCDKFHLIGHAQGAHAAGFAGKYLIKWRGCKVRRITGLSPTGISFNDAPPEKRLDRNDANFVDVIHAGGGGCFPLAISTLHQLGHVDFYPNGGGPQPNCFLFTLESYLKLDIAVATQSLYPAVCYVYQSIRYFLASINPCRCQFIGVECDSYEAFKYGKCRSCGQNGSKCAIMGMDGECYANNTDNDGISQEGFLNQSTQCPKEIHCFGPGNCSKITC